MKMGRMNDDFIQRNSLGCNGIKRTRGDECNSRDRGEGTMTRAGAGRIVVDIAGLVVKIVRNEEEI